MPVRVKQENSKVKQEKIKQDRKGKSRAHVEEDEQEPQPSADATRQEEETAGQYEEDGETGSPRGSKRVRVNGDGHSIPSGSQQQLAGEDEEQHQPLPRVATLPRGADGYIPGSIVRIQLQNFVTYDYVQFYPGPYLNMIIGPNGTGKSSIACAIALGLNFPPAILGRANELHAYVKNGTESGYIEIELKGPSGRSNLIIRRNLQASSKGSSFTLNGQSATGNEIKHKMAELNVQVGNLCSFLPQDRVSEFAAMSPQQLLRETQRAAGDEKLTSWHDTLISSGKDFRQIHQTLMEEEKALQHMIERNEGIKNEVERFNERKNIEHAINLLEVLIPVAEYREYLAKYRDSKTKQRKLHAKVQKLKAKNAPAHNLLKKFDNNFKDSEKRRDELKKSTIAKFRKLGDKHAASDKLETESGNILDRISSLKDEEKRRAKEIKTLEAEVARLLAEINKPPPEGLATDDDIKRETRQINAERQSLITRRNEFDDQLKREIDAQARHNSDIEAAVKELKKQDNADIQKLQKMSGWDKATHLAIDWVRKNRNLFKMEIFETPFMRLTVKDKRFTNAVEACFSSGQMRTFVAQCQEDCDTLNYHINDKKILGDFKITTWFRAQQEEFLNPPPMSPEEMRDLGFDGYAIDYVDYPEGLKWFLMKDLNLHRTAIALKKVDVNRAMSLVARPTQFSGGGATFISGTTLNNVTRSRYGKKAIGNITKDVPQARNLTIPTIDPKVKADLEARIKQAKEAKQICETNKGEINREIDGIEAEDKVFRDKIAVVTEKKAALTNEVKRVQGAKSRYAAKSETLQNLRKKPSADKEKVKLVANLKTNIKKRLGYQEDYMVLVHAIIQEQEQCTTVGLDYLQNAANKLYLTELCEKKDEKFSKTLEEYNQAQKAFEKIKVESKDSLERSRVAITEASDEIKLEYNQIQNARSQWEEEVKEAQENGQPLPDDSGIETRTVGQLQAEIETQRARLEMNLITNPGVVEQYEKRKRDIAQLEKTIADRKKKEEKIARDIKNARDNWHPALQRLVARIGQKFSAAFDRIGCAGEIKINENDDYEKWAIDILVKFRDSEKLQLLTAHRQSGGERSLTTILYLMSLTEEARAPFSLVDEINQGMDQRAERVVHNSMVNVTCRADSAQYFLITPKLLPGLEYDEKMKILCVNNGEWLPEERDIGRMSDMIDVYEKHVDKK